MIGISVSLYDKFEDMCILKDIIRENWDDEYYISVCSNHPEADEKITNIRSNIDSFKKGDDIVFEGRYDDEVNFRMRLNNTIRTAIEGALYADEVDHVMHLHADAWPLAENELVSIIDKMENNSASVGFKVATEKFLRRYPPGHFMDQFIIFEADSCIDEGIFDTYEYQLPPDILSHHLLPMVCLANFGWEGMYHYSTRFEEEYWDGKRTDPGGRLARPMMYNPIHKQVHIAKEDFPGDLGKSLQAHYLNSHNLTNGEYVEKLIDRYKIDRDTLFGNLNDYYERVNDDLKWYYGLDVESLHRDPVAFQRYIGLKNRDELKKIIRYHLRVSKDTIYDILDSLLLIEDGSTRLGENKPDETLHEYYKRMLQSTDYPEEFNDTFGLS